MIIAEGVFEGVLEGDVVRADRRYRITSDGIARERRLLRCWPDVCLVQAWLTSSYNDWGFEEAYHLQLTYADGYNLHVTDDMPDAYWFYTDVEHALNYYLGVKIDWQGTPTVKYQQYKQKPLLRRLFASRAKAIVYQRHN